MIYLHINKESLLFLFYFVMSLTCVTIGPSCAMHFLGLKLIKLILKINFKRSSPLKSPREFLKKLAGREYFKNSKTQVAICSLRFVELYFQKVLLVFLNLALYQYKMKAFLCKRFCEEKFQIGCFSCLFVYWLSGNLSPGFPKLVPESNLHHCSNATVCGLSAQQLVELSVI